VQVTHNGGCIAFESPDGKTLYYTLSGGGAEGLFAKQLPDGEEKQVVNEGVAWRGFAVFPDGVYYLHQSGRYGHDIRFYEFAGGQRHVVGDVGGEPLSLGFAVSPDRKTFLFSKDAGEGSDLMLIENFR
jgi:Tol biopolymer transport system component